MEETSKDKLKTSKKRFKELALERQNRKNAEQEKVVAEVVDQPNYFTGFSSAPAEGNFDHFLQLDKSTLEDKPAVELVVEAQEPVKIIEHEDPPASLPHFNEAPAEPQQEKPNEDVFLMLEQERLCNQQINMLNVELQQRIFALETQLQNQSFSEEFNIKLTGLSQDLNHHKQTINMLVSEKSELNTLITDLESKLKGKVSDCEELQGRLKTSRSRVADLERELQSYKMQRSKSENSEKEQEVQLEKLKQEHGELRQQNEELVQDLLEVKEKLKQAENAENSAQNTILDLKNKLNLAEVKIQQFTGGDVAFDQNAQEKANFEKQINFLNESLNKVTKERDDVSGQYQLYVQQLNDQVSSLWSRIEQLQHENDTLIKQEESRIKHIGDLERQLQSEQQLKVVPKKLPEDNTFELSKLQEEKLVLEKQLLENKAEKDDLIKELTVKSETVSQLEGLLEQLRGNQTDSVKLLATMESDKVAAARAVAQNKDLKEQMDSMQEVFEKLNNDKVELTELLTQQQQNSKDVFEKLQKTEIHLQTLTEAIEIKDRELSNLRDKNDSLHKELLMQYSQLDRLRHYDAQSNSSESLQEALKHAQETILQQKNLIENLKNQKPSNANEDLDVLLNKEATMKHLEDKVKKTMQEIADLSEEKQQLEHLVLQLQGETETIGEYVALYQHQRSVLKQRALEKDQQLKQLANDREQMKIKLQKLNNLIRELVKEKGLAATNELLREHDHFNGICEVHSKLHGDEILENEDKLIQSETAEQIIALLSEIKNSKLVEPEENLHHCAWCSGELFTV